MALEQRLIDGAQADAHYFEHVERDFYPPLRAFVTSGPLVALVLEGDEAIEVVRAINGATDGRKAAPGTIRGDLSLSNRENLVHGSDSPESAAREIALWFPALLICASVSQIVRHRTGHRFAQPAGAARCGLRPPCDTLPRRGRRLRGLRRPGGMRWRNHTSHIGLTYHGVPPW